jgi:hypothetical protein
MIDRTPIAVPSSRSRDERSMRVVEYLMAILAIAAAVLLSFR